MLSRLGLWAEKETPPAAAASALLPSGGVDGSPKASSFSCLRWKAIAAASSDEDMEVFASWRA